MSMRTRLAILPGEGIVQRTGDVILVVPEPDRDPGMTRALVEACAQEVPPRLLRRLGRIVLDADDPVAFGVVAASQDGATVFLRGEVSFAALIGEREVTGHGGESTTWLERSLPGPIARIAVGTAPSDSEPDAWTDLRDGIAAGASALVVTAAAAADRPAAPEQAEEAPEPVASSADPRPPSRPEPEPEPPEDADEAEAYPPPPPPEQPTALEPMDIPSTPPPTPEPASAVHISLEAGEDLLADRTPLPLEDEPDPEEQEIGADGPAPAIVRGVRCPVDHHNNPAASYCSSCGRKLGISRSIVLVDGPRPPLGVLIVDDGSTIPVQVDLVLGREPEGDPLVGDGHARAVRIPDSSQSVSRSHLHVQLDEWDVIVSDRGSSNGTFIWDEQADDWRRLRAAEQVRIDRGTRLQLGERELIFDQHHVR